MFATVRFHRLLPIAGALALTACFTHSPPTHTNAPTLYERLGGQPAINAVVDDFVANVAADQRINRFFATASSPTPTCRASSVCWPSKFAPAPAAPVPTPDKT